MICIVGNIGGVAKLLTTCLTDLQRNTTDVHICIVTAPQTAKATPEQLLMYMSADIPTPYDY